jgi:hypothetical protein
MNVKRRCHKITRKPHSPDWLALHACLQPLQQQLCYTCTGQTSDRCAPGISSRSQAWSASNPIFPQQVLVLAIGSLRAQKKNCFSRNISAACNRLLRFPSRALSSLSSRACQTTRLTAQQMLFLLPLRCLPSMLFLMLPQSKWAVSFPSGLVKPKARTTDLPAIVVTDEQLLSS